MTSSSRLYAPHSLLAALLPVLLLASSAQAQDYATPQPVDRIAAVETPESDGEKAGDEASVLVHLHHAPDELVEAVEPPDRPETGDDPDPAS